MVRLFNRIAKQKADDRPQRRHPRILITDQTVRLITSMEPDGPVQVHNLSCTGLALRQDSFSKLPKVNSRLEGDLLIDHESFPIALEIIHLASPFVGCAFVSDTDRVADAINAKFQFELSAHSLVKMQPGILAPVKDGTPYYYYSKKKEELYFIRDDGGIASFNLTFSGLYIEGGHRKKLRMGKVKVDIKNSVNEANSLMPVDFNETIDPTVLEKARIFIANIQWLSRENYQLLNNLLNAIN